MLSILLFVHSERSSYLESWHFVPVSCILIIMNLFWRRRWHHGRWFHRAWEYGSWLWRMQISGSISEVFALLVFLGKIVELRSWHNCSSYWNIDVVGWHGFESTSIRPVISEFFKCINFLKPPLLSECKMCLVLIVLDYLVFELFCMDDKFWCALCVAWVLRIKII